jgi:hypothetical protein
MSDEEFNADINTRLKNLADRKTRAQTGGE